MDEGRGERGADLDNRGAAQSVRLTAASIDSATPWPSVVVVVVGVVGGGGGGVVGGGGGGETICTGGCIVGVQSALQRTTITSLTRRGASSDNDAIVIEAAHLGVKCSGVKEERDREICEGEALLCEDDGGWGGQIQ